MIEAWKISPSFPDYEVSSLGRVRNTKTGRVLRPIRNLENGRLTHGLSKGRRVGLNRLVCEAFHGPPPFAKAEAAHKNDDCTDNTPDNLYWATRLQNVTDKLRNGLQPRGSKHGSAKLTEAEIPEIRRRCAAGEPLIAIAVDYGVSDNTICGIKNGKLWTHVPDPLHNSATAC